MKQHNKVARLKDRQDDYNRMMNPPLGKKAPDNPDGYHKPGSFKH
jgi:hypothetical protein